MRSVHTRLAALALAVAAPFAAAADARPAPLVVIVPFTQNGPTDNIARPVADALGRALERKVVVKNIVGAGGTVGARQGAAARPDGDTVLLTNVSQAAAPALYPKLGYSPTADFEPVGLVADVPMVLLGKSSLKADSFAALRQLAASRPLVVGHAGKGSSSHLCEVMLARALKVRFVERAYPGTDQAVNDLVTEGNIDLLCDQVSNAAEPARAKSVKVFGVTAPARVDVLPEVPTLAEQGLTGFEFQAWHGLYAPKGTPAAMVDRLAAALARAGQDNKLQKELAARGARLPAEGRQGPKALAQRLDTETARWREIGASPPR